MSGWKSLPMAWVRISVGAFSLIGFIGHQRQCNLPLTWVARSLNNRRCRGEIFLQFDTTPVSCVSRSHLLRPYRCDARSHRHWRHGAVVRGNIYPIFAGFDRNSVSWGSWFESLRCLLDILLMCWRGLPRGMAGKRRGKGPSCSATEIFSIF